MPTASEWTEQDFFFADRHSGGPLCRQIPFLAASSRNPIPGSKNAKNGVRKWKMGSDPIFRRKLDPTPFLDPAVNKTSQCIDPESKHWVRDPGNDGLHGVALGITAALDVVLGDAQLLGHDGHVIGRGVGVVDFAADLVGIAAHAQPCGGA